MITVKIGNLTPAIEELLEGYRADILNDLDRAAEKASKNLVKKTKASAPADTGSFKHNIASKKLETTRSSSVYVWYVKAPEHRLTHLLVHGHAKVNGGRTRADPFLANALAEVLPEYEKDVKEAIKGG